MNDGDPGSERGANDGFAVDLDSVLHVRAVLGELTESHLRAQTLEASHTAVPAIEDGRRPDGPATAPVPDWHDRLDRRWQYHRAALLRDQTTAVLGLEAAVRAYLDCDTALAAGMHSAPTAQPTAQSPAPAGSARTSILEIPPSARALDHAVAVWRARRELTVDSAEVLHAALDAMVWHGPAAAGFTTWADRDLRRWRDLAEAADIIGRALADASTLDGRVDDGARTPEPRIDTLTDTPPPPTLRETTATRPSGGRPEPPATTHTPAVPDDASTPTAPGVLTAPRVPSPRTGLDDTTASGETASGSLAERGSMAPQPVTEVLTGTPGTTGAMTGSSTAIGAIAAPSQPGPPAPDGPTVPMVPSAAVAGATALAQAERAHHVIREVTLPPTHSAPPSASPDTLLAPQPRGRTDPPRSPTAPPPGAGAWPNPGAPARCAPGLPGPQRPWRQRRPGDRARRAMWVNLHPARPGGAWLDLTARPGTGFTGPGSADIIRTALHELRTHTPTVLIIPRRLLDDLTLDAPLPGQRLNETEHHDEQVRVVDHPYDGLQQLRTSGPRPSLLVVPAPTSTEARTQLTETLHALAPGPASALMIGPWPSGSELCIDHHHHVDAHHNPTGTDLTGQTLQATTAEQLAHVLTSRVTPTITDAGDDHPGHTDAGSVGDDNDIDEAITAPVALRVLGPVELRHRPTSEREPVTIGPLPRLARELLAWLAAHPEGATRDHLVDVLCPDSTARRPETTLYAALSRLRRLVVDTTGDDTTSELVTTHHGRWILNPAVTTVDYWTLLATATTAPHGDDRRRTLIAALESYQGLFAADLSPIWAHTIREAARRHHLGIINELVELDLSEGDHVAALTLLERARHIEPTNEALYRSIMTIQLSLGRGQDAQRTYDLLRTELAVIDAEPEPPTQRLLASATAHAR